MRRGIMSLEGLEEPIVPAELPEAEVTDFVEAPENDLAEAAVEEGELAEVNAGIEEAAETAETLDDVHDAMADSLEEGGMSEPEARALEVAVEHLCQRVGFSSRRKTFPAMEGFKVKGADQIKNTKIAMENIKERAAQLWAAVIATLSKAWEHAKNFFRAISDGAARLKKRADALQKQADATKESHGPDGKKIASGSFGHVLTVDGKLPKNTAMVAAYEKHAGDKFVTLDRSELISQAAPSIEKVAKGESVEAINEAFDEAVSILYAHFKDLSATSKEDLNVGEDTVVKGHKLTFGGAEFVLIGAPTYTKVLIRTVGEKAELGEVEALTSEDASKLAKAVSAHLATYEKSATVLGETINKISSLVNRLKANKAEDQSVIKTTGDAIRALNQAVVQSSVILKSYDTKVAKAALDYVGASLSGPKAEKPAAA